MNTLLAWVTFPLILWSSGLSRTRVGARPGSLMAAFFWLLGVFGSQLWMWSRNSQGAGLPASISSEPFDTSRAATALLLAALGSAAGALCMSRQLVGAPKLDFSRVLSYRRLPAIVAMLEFIGLVLWLIGQGPNIRHRIQYLDTQGPGFLVRATGVPCTVLVLAGVIVLILAPRQRRTSGGRAMLFILTLAWTASLIAKGSRTAAAIPIIAAVLLLAPSIRRCRSTPTTVALVGGLFFSSLVCFSAAYAARSGVGGYDQLPRMLGVGWDEATGGKSLQRMVASVVSGYPIIEHSIAVRLPWDIIAQNSNPLPGTAADPSIELYMPYKWVPLAVLGELYGAIGGTGTTLTYFGLAVIMGSASRKIAASRFPYIYLVPSILAAGFAVFSVQYTSRLFWRMVSIAILLFLVSFMARKRADDPARISEPANS